MSPLFRILYAAHANGTHHKLALDALQHMERADAEAWGRVFLKHAPLYLEGSKAPDNSFKDFKNHVLHVSDAYWGGAPEKVEAWYGHTVAALREERFGDAAYAAGVLSHYYTDPIHPFHTAQTEAENSIHRAVEWSINRSYNALRALGEQRFPAMTVKSHNGAHWLKEMTCDGAEFSHRYYEKLIAHYNFKIGAVRPEEGLDDVGRGIVAELLMYAADGFGHILDRAIAEAGIAAPEVSLTLESVIATLNIPAKWIEKKLTNAGDRAIVQAMYDELKATGKVEHSLPEDDRVIRDLHKREVLERAQEVQLDKRAVRVPDGDPADARKARRTAHAKSNIVKPVAFAGMLDAAAAPVQAATQKKAVKRIEIEAEMAPEAEADPAPSPDAVEMEGHTSPPPSWGRPGGGESQVSPARIPPTAQSGIPPTAQSGIPPTAQSGIPPTAQSGIPPTAQSGIPPTPSPSPQGGGEFASLPHKWGGEERAEQRRYYLTAIDDLEKAPSIGPKMAERFAGLGIKTVADFLAHAPHDMADLLEDKRIKTETLHEWQDQAVLVMEIAGLRGTHAQLLTGAGYRDAASIASAEPVDFSADVLKFATSDAGKRILREGNPPDIEKIKGWVESARLAKAA